MESMYGVAMALCAAASIFGPACTAWEDPCAGVNPDGGECVDGALVCVEESPFEEVQTGTVVRRHEKDRGPVAGQYHMAWSPGQLGRLMQDAEHLYFSDTHMDAVRWVHKVNGAHGVLADDLPSVEDYLVAGDRVYLKRTDGRLLVLTPGSSEGELLFEVNEQMSLVRVHDGRLYWLHRTPEDEIQLRRQHLDGSGAIETISVIGTSRRRPRRTHDAAYLYWMLDDEGAEEVVVGRSAWTDGATEVLVRLPWTDYGRTDDMAGPVVGTNDLYWGARSTSEEISETGAILAIAKRGGLVEIIVSHRNPPRGASYPPNRIGPVSLALDDRDVYWTNLETLVARVGK